MSSNPFRKKTPGPAGSFRASSPRSSMRGDQQPAAPDDRKNKPTKRVRVLSPPLGPSDSSPDGAQPPDAGAGAGVGADSPSGDPSGSSHDDASSDPFGGAWTDESDREGTMTRPAPLQSRRGQDAAAVTGHGTPANPFSKTPRQVEASDGPHGDRREDAEAPRAAPAGRRSLDVDAFRSLLMTGRADRADDARSPDAHHQTQAVEAQQDQRPSKDRKPPPRPPPPSSRHGKSLSRHESVPDLSPAASPPSRKSAPAPPPPPPPPPPRGHARSDSKVADAEGPSHPASRPVPAPPPSRRPSSAPRSQSQSQGQSQHRLSPPAETPTDTARARKGPPVPPPRTRTASGTPPAKPDAQSPDASGKSAGILADLDALQREVDALRGSIE
ncbi:hypothetical protein E4U53_003881 [Claviceps sorghi]|nr:hypothetical protein E4U53_003881 [Claviceps sorghi]